MSKSNLLSFGTRYIKFAVSTLAGTAVDMIVLWLCSDYLLPNVYWGEYLLAPFISFECAVLTNFIMAYYAVWRERISARTFRSFMRHYAGYNLSCTGTFLFKMGILLLVERLFGLDVLWCNIIALCFSGIANFLLNEFVIFRKPKK